MENLITIKLFGQTYTFKTEAEISKAKAVAESVAKEVDRVQEKGPHQTCELTKLTIMILVALNLAGENVDLKNNRKELIEKMTERSSRLLDLIDQGNLLATSCDTTSPGSDERSPFL